MHSDQKRLDTPSYAQFVGVI